MLKYFTIADLKSWLYQNKVNGLSSEIISKSRGLALVNHPDSNDDDIALSVIYDENELAGYTAIFKEKFVKPVPGKIYAWGTTLYVIPKYRGRHLGNRLMIHIKEACDYRYLGLDSSEISIKIDSKQGSRITFYDKYIFVLKQHVIFQNFKSIFSLVNVWKKKTILFILRRKILLNIKNEKYEVEYVSYIDNEIYSFIVKNSINDLFLRKQSVLNWIIQHHFINPAPLYNRIQNDYKFSTYAKRFEIYPVKVLFEKHLIGFFILKFNDDDLSLMYLYYQLENELQVFHCLIEHIIELNPSKFTTFHKKLQEFIIKKGLYIRYYTDNVAFTFPQDFKVDNGMMLQGGDGDMLV